MRTDISFLLDSLARNELSEIHDRKELQRLVVTAEFDDDNDGDIDSETVVMPQGVTIERLRGIKWKKRWQPKRIEQRLQQEMVAFNAKQLAHVAANGGGAGDSSSSSSDSEDEHGRRVPMTLASGADGGVNVIAASGSTGATEEMSEEALMFSFINKYCITSDKFTTTKDFIEYAHTRRHVAFVVCMSCASVPIASPLVRLLLLCLATAGFSTPSRGLASTASTTSTVRHVAGLGLRSLRRTFCHRT